MAKADSIARIGCHRTHAGCHVIQAAGIGYSSALQTMPGLSEKSMRGGAKISTSQPVWSPTLRLV